MARLIAKNWGDFQHYKDRSPAWIKLHKKLLDDYEFQSLPVASRALAPMLWLLASEESDGSIEYDINRMAFRLRSTSAEIEEAIKPLIERGFFELVGECLQPASATIAPCLPREEKRREERETEKSNAHDAPAPSPKPKKSTPAIPKPDDVTEQTWNDWLQLRKLKRAAVTDTVINHAKAEAEKAGMPLERFLQVWCARGSQGLEASWLKPSERAAPPRTVHDISKMDYSKGDSDDGSF